jgi:hypothetical protein
MRRFAATTSRLSRTRRLVVVAGLAVVALLIPATGQAKAPPPSLAWSPTTGTNIYDYGSLDVNATAPVVFTLTNTGGKSAGTVWVTLTGGSAFTITADTCSGSALGPNRTCNVTVKFAPTSGGSDSATLTATGEHASTSITLKGSAGTPDLVISPYDRYLGTSGGFKEYQDHQSSIVGGSQTYTVKNSGGGPTAALTVSLTGGGGIGFSVPTASDQCAGAVLNPNATCTFVVDYPSATEDDQSGYVQVTDSTYTGVELIVVVDGNT